MRLCSLLNDVTYCQKSHVGYVLLSIFTCGKWTFFASHAKKNSNFSIDQLVVHFIELQRLKCDIFTAR